MKFIDLFAGIGGFRYGLESVGNKVGGEQPQKKRKHALRGGIYNKSKPSTFRCVYSNEWNKYAAQVYKKHYGECDTTDITKVKAKDIPDHDLLTAGFPCQAFSIAGKRRGLEDTRGTLFFDIARIASHKRPRYLLLENVKGLLSHDKGKTFQTILGVLSDLGYQVEWQVLNSKHFGVPQNRERVFIVGHLGGKRRRKVFPIGGQNKASLKEYTKKESQGMRVYSDKGTSATLAGQAGGWGAKTGLYAIPEATSKGYAIAKEGDSINLAQINSKTRRGRIGRGEAQTLDTGMQQHTIQNKNIRRLTPTECARLQGFPDDWCEGLSDTQQYKCYGNAVTTNVVTAIGYKLL